MNDLNWRESLKKEIRQIDQYEEDNKKRLHDDPDRRDADAERDYSEMLHRIGLDANQVFGGETWRSSRTGLGSRSTHRLRPLASRGSTVRSTRHPLGDTESELVNFIAQHDFHKYIMDGEMKRQIRKMRRRIFELQRSGTVSRVSERSLLHSRGMRVPPLSGQRSVN